MVVRNYKLSFEIQVPKDTTAARFREILEKLRENLKNEGVGMSGPYAREIVAGRSQL